MADKNAEEELARSDGAKSAFSKGTADLRVPLSHRLTQKLMARHFARLDHKFYVSTKILREQRRSSEAVEIEKQLNTLFATFSGELAKASDDIKSARTKKQSFDLCSVVHYDGLKELTVSVSTSFSTRLLIILKTFDDFLSELDELELSLCIAPEVCANAVNEWRRKLLAFLAALSEVCNKPQPT